MATYKEIKGTQIEVLASDPSNPIEGQVWFNSTDNVLKGRISNPAGSWSTANSINTARGAIAGAGTTTAAIIFGGEPYSADTSYKCNNSIEKIQIFLVTLLKQHLCNHYTSFY